jgi:hypothetical protein
LVVTKHIWSLMKFVKWLKMRIPCELWYCSPFFFPDRYLFISAFFFPSVKKHYIEKKNTVLLFIYLWFQLWLNNLIYCKKNRWGILICSKKKIYFEKYTIKKKPVTSSLLNQIVVFLLCFVLNCFGGDGPRIYIPRTRPIDPRTASGRVIFIGPRLLWISIYIYKHFYKTTCNIYYQTHNIIYINIYGFMGKS